jgi:two-component system cell cycle sensor histidine kinase/response regulator CckA
MPNKPDTVLIVEDEETLRALLETVLQENGIKVLTANDGIDALEVFGAHKDEICVVLSDLGLPNMGGWDVFLKMKEINSGLKGILASGYFTTEMRDELIRAGADDFIPKPYNTSEIIGMIKKLLPGENMPA